MSQLSALSPERLFSLFFWPVYPDDVRADLATARATDANPAKNPAIVAELDAIAQRFVDVAKTAFDGLDLGLDYSDGSVHRLGAELTRERRDRWAAERGPDGVPVLTHVVLHGALYVGACVVRRHEGEWQARRPLWESLVRVRSRAGEGDLAIFQWWLKALSDGEIDRHTLADRYRAYVEMPRATPEALPRIAPPDRRLPRLAKVRYDTLFKHFRAHLPELRDLGADFPSPERFSELGFHWLEFVWLGEGRMLLVHGPTDRGVHLYWLDVAGFAKAAFYPADAVPAHRIEVDGEKLRVVVPMLGSEQVHEMLWWGP